MLSMQKHGEGLVDTVPTHTSPPPLAWVLCILDFFSRLSSYTLTTLNDLGSFPSPHKQCIYKLSLGLGLQTIRTFIHSTNICRVPIMY